MDIILQIRNHFAGHLECDFVWIFCLFIFVESRYTHWGHRHRCASQISSENANGIKMKTSRKKTL